MIAPPIEAQGFSRIADQGGSRPMFLTCIGQAGDVLTKFAQNDQNPRVLVNEFAAGHIAALLGLPAPTPRVVYVSQKFIDDIDRVAHLWDLLRAKRQACPNWKDKP